VSYEAERNSGGVDARLNADPEWVARKKERDEAFQREHDENVRAEAPLVKDLRVAGVPVNSAWDLVNMPTNAYPQSLLILLDHLQRPYPDAVRDGIARALAVPDAKFAWPLLVKLYREEREKRTKTALAMALSNIADDAVIDELITLARDPQHGVSRAALLDGLRRTRLPQARAALREFETDPFLKKEAQRILRRLKRMTRSTS
jgi:HEAT repeat protein